MSIDTPLSQVCEQLSREFGLAFDLRAVNEFGYTGWSLVYDRQAEDGLSFEIRLSTTMLSAEAVFLPGSFSGKLVRAIADGILVRPQDWADQVDASRAADVSVTVEFDGEIEVDPRSPASSGPQRSIQIQATCSVQDRRDSSSRLAALLLASRSVLSVALSTLDVSSEPVDEDLVEGNSVAVLVNRYERNPVARMRAIEHFGCSCWVCDLNFADRYEGLGAGFIHVHHRVMVSAHGGHEYRVDPIRDLIPLCPNCHAMIHQRNPPFDPAELRSRLGLPEKEPLPEPQTWS